MTPTPRTDKAEAKFTEDWENYRDPDWPPAPPDGFNLAREIERENAELFMILSELYAACSHPGDSVRSGKFEEVMQRVAEKLLAPAARSALEPAQPPAQEQ